MKKILFTMVIFLFLNSCEKKQETENLFQQESPTFSAPDCVTSDMSKSLTSGIFYMSPTPSSSIPLTSFTPTQLYAAATYALAVDENGNASYLYMGHNTDGSDMNYPDFKEYLCAGIVEDSHGPCIITQDLKKRVGGMTSKEWEALLDDSLLSGETVGEGIYSAVERLKQQETWQDVCQMICVWGDWYAALRTDGTVVSLGCFGSYETVEEDWCDIVQIVSGGEALFGLKSDGTVYAHLEMNPMVYGKTREEEIREWSDIVQIAGGNSVVGLRKDGTVVTIKGGIFRECQEWSNITKIAASRYAIVGIREDGTVIAKCSKQCGFTEEELAGWKEIEQIAVCDDYCIAVGKDKTVYRTGPKG